MMFSLKSLANSKDIEHLQESISTLREFAIDIPYSQRRQEQVPFAIDLLNSRSRDLHQHVRKSWDCECRGEHSLYVGLSSETDDTSLSLLFVSRTKHLNHKPDTNAWTWQPSLFSCDEVEVAEDTVWVI